MEKIYKFKLDLKFLNIGSIILFFILFIPCILLFDMRVNFDFNFLVVMCLWLILHEILHGIGFGIFKGVNHNNIKYGMELESGVFYCMCTQRISKNNILVSLLFPFTFIGIVTLIIGALINNSNLIMLSIINIAGAIGDLTMFISISMMPKNIEYIDLDDTTGFYLISTSDLSKEKLIGFKFDSSSKVTKEMLEPKKRDKITISKSSYIIMAIILGISILYNIFSLVINLM